MHFAAELAQIELVEMLLKARVDLTLQDKVRSLQKYRKSKGRTFI